MKKEFKDIFPKKHSIIGMIHLQALPGTPVSEYSMSQIIEMALTDAAIYDLAGVDGLMIENMHDVPYLNREVGHEITAAMSVIANEIKRDIDLPCGVQVLAGANKSALAIAKAADLEFIRGEGFVFGHVADEGWMSSDAGELLRYRKMIEADDILIFNDIKKKHSSHTITADVDLVATAKAAEYFRSDGLIITGSSTGVAADLKELKAVKAECNIPIMIGSGVTLKNVKKYFKVADALIVGSYFKKDGHWGNEVEYDRVAKFMEVVDKI